MKTEIYGVKIVDGLRSPRTLCSFALISLSLICLVIAGCRLAPRRELDTSKEVLSTLQSALPSGVELKSVGFSQAGLAGVFTNPGQQLVRRIGPALAGQKLTLFRDKTFQFEFWADILPAEVWDKGSWRWDGKKITLESDQSLPKKLFPRDRDFIPLVYKTPDCETLLVIGLESDYQHLRNLLLETHSHNFDIFIYAFEKDSSVSPRGVDRR